MRNRQTRERLYELCQSGYSLDDSYALEPAIRLEPSGNPHDTAIWGSADTPAYLAVALEITATRPEVISSYEIDLGLVSSSVCVPALEDRKQTEYGGREYQKLLNHWVGNAGKLSPFQTLDGFLVGEVFTPITKIVGFSKQLEGCVRVFTQDSGPHTLRVTLAVEILKSKFQMKENKRRKSFVIQPFMEEKKNHVVDVAKEPNS
jgi:hypothetical protein